jgi:hypothetical protein
VKLSPLTPTLSREGERENEVKNDYIKTALQKAQRDLLRGYQQ